MADTGSYVLVTGASAGLGLAIAKAFVIAGIPVIGLARDRERLLQAAAVLNSGPRTTAAPMFRGLPADITNPASVANVFAEIKADPGQLRALVNCVGVSDRGALETLPPERLRELIEINVISCLRTSQAALPMLKQSRGMIVNIGSLASRVGSPWLGAYPASKHALAGLTQQMRMEWQAYGIQVALVLPGPIRRDDAGQRYRHLGDEQSIPEHALQPGGGTSLPGLDPDWVAARVVRCVQHREADVVIPSKARLLFTIQNAFPRLGDRILRRFMK